MTTVTTAATDLNEQQLDHAVGGGVMVPDIVVHQSDVVVHQADVVVHERSIVLHDRSGK